MEIEEQLKEAAERVVRAFGSHDVEHYFACFAEDASFVFYSTLEVITSRPAFRREWERLETEEGYRVLGCTASDRRVQVLTPDVGIVMHTLESRVATNAGEQQLLERESLVLRIDESRGWLIVHEHLSPCP